MGRVYHYTTPAKLELAVGFEPTTCRLQIACSAIELHQLQNKEAGRVFPVSDRLGRYQLCFHSSASEESYYPDEPGFRFINVEVHSLGLSTQRHRISLRHITGRQPAYCECCFLSSTHKTLCHKAQVFRNDSATFYNSNPCRGTPIERFYTQSAF